MEFEHLSIFLSQDDLVFRCPRVRVAVKTHCARIRRWLDPQAQPLFGVCGETCRYRENLCRAPKEGQGPT